MDHLGLYLHIPFCKNKCRYCNFFSFCTDERTWDEYTEQMVRMVRKKASEYSDMMIDTIYFGGGTPSVLGNDRLCVILSEIRKCFSVEKDAEITFEANPTSADSLDFSLLCHAGFNRISFGLQSANQHELDLLGRKHTPEDAYRVIRSAKMAGFDNLSLDIMLAIPKQNEDSLKKTIDFCNSCDVQHISAYILKVEDGTPFGRMRDKLDLPDDDRQARLYETVVSELKRLGFEQYEISNFAKKGYQSRHNLKYWHDEEYLGLGPSAHSFINGKRFFYPSDLSEFYANQTVFESLGGDTDEYIMLRLRLSEGLSFHEFEEKYHPALRTHRPLPPETPCEDR